MLFNSLLEEIDRDLKPAFDDAFSLALKRQTHSGDLLLVMESAALVFEPEDGDPSRKHKIYYTLGDGMSGHCQRTHYDFISSYMKGHAFESHVKYEDYISGLKGDKESWDKHEQLEANTIQVEMMIYLKIWEDELFLKQWYQLSLLLARKDYDWDFKIGFDYKKENKGILTRRTVHQKINESMKDAVPVLQKYFSASYNGKLRNAIAHSQYAIIGRDIYLTNHRVEEKGLGYPGLSFSEWNEIFNTTLLLSIRFAKLLDKVREYYFEQSLQTRKKREIRVSRRFPEYTSFLSVVHTREIYKDWSPHPDP